MARHRMTVLIDQREKRPYGFTHSIAACPGWSIDLQTTLLRTADYSLACPSHNPKDHIVIERKTLADLYGSLGRHRGRLRREFERLSAFGYAALVVEAGWDLIARPVGLHSQLNPKSVFATLVAWSQRYGVHVFAFPDRDFAEQAVFRMLQRWQRDRDTGERGRLAVSAQEGPDHGKRRMQGEAVPGRLLHLSRQ